MARCLYSMPIIVLNMGSEMTYILAQRLLLSYYIVLFIIIICCYYYIIRLSAQKISNDKAQKVLEDVLLASFSSVFIEELFKPQEIYTVNRYYYYYCYYITILIFLLLVQNKSLRK